MDALDPVALDPIPPDALADMMLAGALEGHADVIAMQPSADACAVTLESGGAVVAGLRVPREVGDAAAARFAAVARFAAAAAPDAGPGHVARLAVRTGTRSGVVVLSMGALGSAARIEIQRLASSSERPASLKRCPSCGAFHPPQRVVCDVDGAGLLDVPDDPVMGGTIGVYRIGSLLGAGQMGAVFAGVHALIGRPVAVKVLHRSLAQNPVITRRFLNEARAASRLRHENVVEVTDFGLLRDARPFLVMERLAGEPLEERLAREGGLVPRTALLLSRVIAAALGAAHAGGVVHNDLKPANVMLLSGSTDEVPRLKLVDFGAAALREEAAGDSGLVIGTPHYMSPERANGEQGDARADLYALGVMLYEMLSGHVPYTGPCPEAVLYAHVWQEPAPLKSPHGRLPAAVLELVSRALKKAPTARYQTADEMTAGIDQALEAVNRPPWRRLLG
jgi:serine/threonine-protein kinase